MLQSGSCNCELDSLLGALAGQQAVDQAAAEGVTAANAVNDLQLVLLGEAVLVGSNIVQHCAPAVLGSVVALTQGDSDLLEVELVSQLLGNALVALSIQLTAVDIGSLGLDAEHVLCVLLVGDANVNVLAQIGHGSAGLLTGPQLAAVVQVAADLHAVSLSSLAGLQADLNNVCTQSRGDAGEVEPVHALEDLTAQNAKLDSLLGGLQFSPEDPDAEALRTLCAQTVPETALSLLDTLTARQAAALEEAGTALQATEAQLNTVQQQLGAAAQAQRLAQQLAARQAELAAAKPALDAARAEADRHAGDAAQLDALTAQVTQAQSALAAYDALDTLCRQQTEARDAARLAAAQAHKRRTQLDSLNAALAAAEAELAALADADTRLLALQNRSAQLTQRGEALVKLEQRLADCQRQAKAAHKAQENYRAAAAAQDEARARRDALERAFLDAQAGLLAESLVEGAPCPVCGSTHHPARALLPHTAPTQAQVEAARQAAAEADRQAQNASAAAQSALAAANEAKTSLRRDAETLLPERFTAPEGTVPLTFALMTNVLAEENAALQTAQTDCKAQCRQTDADCLRKAQLEVDRQAKTRQRPALEQAAAEADRSAAAQNASADALEGQIAERRAALPYSRRADAQAALDKLEADRRTLRTGMDTAQRKLKQAEQTVAAAEAAVEALTAQQTAAQKELPARSAEDLTAQQTELTAARETLRSREKQLSAQLLPNRKTAAQYRAAAEARQTLESRWQWVSALAATAGGTLTSKQKIRLEAYIQMNYLDRILRYANTRLMQMTAGQYELERIGAENQRSQSGLDLGVIDHYNGTRRSVKTLSGGESFKASLALALGLSDEVQSSAGGIRLDTLFLDEGFGSLDEESLELAIRVLSGLTEGDRLVGIISHVGALKDRIDRQVVVHKARTGGSTVELRV